MFLSMIECFFFVLTIHSCFHDISLFNKVKMGEFFSPFVSVKRADKYWRDEIALTTFSLAMKNFFHQINTPYRIFQKNEIRQPFWLSLIRSFGENFIKFPAFSLIMS